jgi:chemotaxis protein CheD
MADRLIVGMAEAQVAAAPATLATLGLGSCVGVCLYDPALKLGGLVHVMLPEATHGATPAKFADTAVPLLIDMMTAKGASLVRLRAKLAGGAQMFRFPNSGDVLKIGERNVAAVQSALAARGVTVVASDVYGNFGRSIEFDCATGGLTVRTIGQGSKEL